MSGRQLALLSAPPSERELIQELFNELVGDLTSAGHVAQRVTHEHLGYCAHNRESPICTRRRALLEDAYAYLTAPSEAGGHARREARVG